MSNVKIISMGSDTFNQMKADITDVMTETLSKMEELESDEATVTLKIKISLEDMDVMGEDKYRKAKRPTFKHTVSSAVTVKTQKDGILTGNNELEKDGNRYIMKPVHDGQMSLFEQADEEEDNEEDEDE